MLAVTTFSVDAATMQRVSVDFLRNATEAGKKRIIVDLSGNPGGSLTAGVDLFHIFFPDVVPYTATRLRAHTGAEFLSKAFARLAESHPKLQFELWDGNPFSWQAAVTPNQDDNFKSLEAWYGPYEIDGVPLSNLYANFNFTSISTTHSPITGYGPIPLDLSQRLYFPEDIIIVRLSCPSEGNAKCIRSPMATASQHVPTLSIECSDKEFARSRSAEDLSMDLCRPLAALVAARIWHTVGSTLMLKRRTI